MAKKIIWTPDMSVGVKEIDDQHKKFISIITDFYDAFNSNLSKDEINQIMQRLIEYADFHFKTEEKYFDEFNYELKDDHKQKHAELEGKALVLKERLLSEGLKVVPEISDFLVDWLTDHVANEDQKYVKCFHDHGLS